ncbi:MAG: hypothetical protein GY861_23620 [bacterium]|nr:hypothetical protein [bacterium]
MKTVIIALILVSCILVVGCGVEQANEDKDISAPPEFPEIETSGNGDSDEIPPPPQMPEVD